MSLFIKGYNGTPEERFWKYTDKKGEDDCWNWKRGLTRKNDKGYGQIWVNGKNVRTNRFSYELHNGNIPEGMYICHHCDNRKCVNPKHLFLGTPKDNVQDMIIKGRRIQFSGRGEKNCNSKLMQKQVLEIKKELENRTEILTSLFRRLAKKYKVSQSCVIHIHYKHTWK
jgi:hypothetical protein